MRISIYDTTLRDGSQGEGINFSLEDKLLLTRRLDELGVDYIEGGYPLSNPKDFEYFQAVRTLPLKHAKIAAFGMTRRKNSDPATDTCLQALLDAHAPVITIVGKTWDMHVTQILGTSLEENLKMIADSVAHCKAMGHEVFYDAEHFFDGFKANPDYALADIAGGGSAGAAVVILCDTNGGTMPEQIAERVSAVRKALKCDIGIHCHNDCDVGRRQFVDRGSTRGHPGSGYDERHRRTLRQCRSSQRDRQFVLEVRLRTLAARQPASAHRGIALCL